MSSIAVKKSSGAPMKGAQCGVEVSIAISLTSMKYHDRAIPPLYLSLIYCAEL